MENYKIRFLKELIQKEYKVLFTNKGEYNQLLKTIGYLGLDNFENNMAIFVQKPGARIVKTFDEWNEAGRYIKRGSKGALTFLDKEKNRIKYYFALEDTYDSHYNKIEEWNIDTDNLFYILNTEFGANSNSDNAIFESVKNFVERNNDYVIKLLNKNDFEYNDDIKEFIIKSVTESVSYRLGYDVSYDYTEYLSKSNWESLCGIGNVIILFNNCFLEKIRKIDLELTRDMVYNHSNKTIINNGAEVIERSGSYDREDTDRLCADRGLSISGNAHRVRGTENNEVWVDAQELHGRESARASEGAGQRVEINASLENGGGRSRAAAQEDNGEERERSDSDWGDNTGVTQRATSSVGSDNDEIRTRNNITSSEGVSADRYTSEGGERPFNDQKEFVHQSRRSELGIEDNEINEKADVDTSAFLVENEKTDVIADKNADEMANTKEMESDSSVIEVEVEFSEHNKIQAGKYDLVEFNSLIAELSQEWFDGKEELIEKYGSIDNAIDNGEFTFVGYAKTRIHIDIPGMESIYTRIDIGDFNTDLVGYLHNYREYPEQLEYIKNYIAATNSKEQDTFTELDNIEEEIEVLEADEVITNEVEDTPIKVMFEQMSLFDFAISQAEQIGDIISAEATKPQVIASNMFISDDLVRDIVASGANYEAKNAMFYRILRPFNTREKMVEFVKNQYEGSMKGITLKNGDKISLYADEEGLKIAHGTRARVKWERLVSYEDILDIATELVKEGKFLSNVEAIYANEQEIDFLANDITNTYWYEYKNDYLPKYFMESRFGFPDLKDRIKQALIDADDNLIDLGNSLRKLLDDHKNGVVKLHKFNLGYYQNAYGNIFDRIALYDSEPIEHQLNDDLEVYQETFITHDFIDSKITHSGFVNGGFRLCKYFSENFTNIQDAAKFLNNEFGTGGNSSGGRNRYTFWHDSKGIQLGKGSLGHSVSISEIVANPKVKLYNAEIKLKYTEVAKILRYLVENDMFFSNDEEKAKYQEWRENLLSMGVTNDVIVEQADESKYERLYKESLADTTEKSDESIDTELRSHDAEGEVGLNEENVEDSIKETVNTPEVANTEENEVAVQLPSVPSGEAKNYRFDLDNYKARDSFAPRSRFRDNVDAIELLKKLEAENRYATTEEQEILAKYVGWGGLQEAFDPNDDKWSNEYNELRNLLTDDEYTAARGSVLTAFYTSPVVIKAMYKALGNMDFKEGSVLEPSCATGNFFGCLPSELENVSLHGVELDSISGRIAKKLYPLAEIEISPYERSNTKNSYYDVAIGNVPFGDFKVYDPTEKKWNFTIHNYFFANTIKKVREGGVIAFITSSFTMDSKTSTFRQYLAERGEFLGAIRLPNTAFKGVAGTEVVSDIIFLKKRDVPTVDIANEPFINVGDYQGHSLNEYFINNPEMVLGELKEVSGRFGNVLTCASNGEDLAELLDKAINNLKPYKIEPLLDNSKATVINTGGQSIPASPDIENQAFGIINGQIYFRNNDTMSVEAGLTDKNFKRLEGLINIKDCLNELISLQLLIPDDDINKQIDITRATLNDLYDKYVKQFGYINNRVNASLIEKDVNRYKLLSLERAIQDSKDYEKADIFVKRTVSPVVEIKSCDNAIEGLAVSISQRGEVDITYICDLCDITEKECLEQLENRIYYDPYLSKYVPADEYLSGDIAEKIEQAKELEKTDNADYSKNIAALEKVMPEKIKAEDISVRLGSNWIPTNVYQDFMYELLSTSYHSQGRIKIGYVQNSTEYFITNKSYDDYRVQVTQTYGTRRKSAYEIIEDTLNLRDSKVYDTVEDDFGNKRSVLNLNETIDAQAKQDIIKEKFVEWIWSDEKRVEFIENLYNSKFNTIRNREFNGSFLTLPGSNPSIKLKEHQLNAVARIVYGGNTLLAHVVGAGKTFEMIAAAMESKRLGLSKKPLFVVPKHLTVQWATEFMTLYPTANILVAKENDFTPDNRKKFCTRIAMGDYDAIIIGHSQFEKIPMSLAYQKNFIEEQVKEIDDEILDIKSKNRAYKLNDVASKTVKRLEADKKRLEARLEQLIDRSKKDNIGLTFEMLGVDRLYVDEAHYYKNLYTRTKMSNIAGIPTTESQKSMDMMMKCQYINRMTNEKGVIFATGTPISNSMVEMYTLQRYLAPSDLKKRSLSRFDAWASTFGNTVTAMELAPEGTGYRMKTRFAKFYNLPELVAMFKQFADVKTADMLELDVPKAEYHNITIESSDFQKEVLLELADRADDVRKGLVHPTDDNMLKITTDGRKLALDQRIISPFMEESENSKTKAVVENAMKLYRQYDEDRAVQVIFCDMSTPTTKVKESTENNDSDIISSVEFKNVYEDIKEKLMAAGVPEKEIAFIHDANTDKRKAELFAKCRAGEVRFLLGSTFKLGAGTNIQTRLIGLHHVDVPWRPSDIEQQEGRIIRQGNMYDNVHIFRYVTEGTFDAYSWQIIENKQKFISQIMTSKTPVRVADDVDETALSYAEVKALASGNPLIKERMDIEQRLSKLEVLKTSYNSSRLTLKKKIDFDIPNNIKQTKESLVKLNADNERIKGMFEDVTEQKQDNKDTDKGNDKENNFPGITINNKYYDTIDEAGEQLIKACTSNKMGGVEVKIGEYRGFKLTCVFNAIKTFVANETPYELRLVGEAKHHLDLGRSATGNFLRLDNALKRIPSKIANHEKNLAIAEQDLEKAIIELDKPFAYEEELKEKKARLKELDDILDLGSPKEEKPPII